MALGAGVGLVLLQCSSQLPPGSGHVSAWGSGAAVPRQGPGVLKAMMLLSPLPRGHCKQWGQTGSQTLGKGSRKLGHNPKVLHRGREARQAGPQKKAPPTPTVPVQPHLGVLCLMSRNLSNPGSGPHAEEQVGRGGVLRADADLGRHWSWPWWWHY